MKTMSIRDAKVTAANANVDKVHYANHILKHKLHLIDDGISEFLEAIASNALLIQSKTRRYEFTPELIIALEKRGINL